MTERKDIESIGEQHFEHCPTCGKELKGIRDYPQIVINDVKVLEIPDVVHAFPAIENVSSVMKEIAASSSITDFLNALAARKGDLSRIDDIPINLPENKHFKHQFEIGRFYVVGIWDSEVSGITELIVSGHFNLGSAGGPKLVKIVSLAEIHYEGVLNHPRNYAAPDYPRLH